MKKIFYTFALIAFTFGVRAQFTANNLAVLRVSDSTSSLSNTGNTVAIDQFTTTGTFVNTTLLPKTGANAVALAGNSTSEGQLTLSTNRSLISFIGYKVTPPNATSITAATAATINRVVVTMNAAGTPSFPVLTAASFSAGNPRSVVSDGTAFWAAGSNTGVVYSAGVNNIDTIVSATTANIRVLGIYAGQLFFTTGSGTVGLHRVGTGTPTASGNASAVYITTAGTGTGTASPYAFAFNNDSNICYISDDRATTSGGGIQKWTRSGSVWSLAYTLGTGASSTVGVRGMVVSWASSTPVIYATTAEGSANRVIKITDIGASSVASTLATSAANTIYRGITFTPGSSALPVKYTSISVTKGTDANILKWSTASETNNNHFEIQRSVDGKNFEAIAKVKGAGNSSKVVSYSFNDVKAPAAKTTYYRLKQVDFDGKAEYSKTVSIVTAEQKTGLGASLPNPFNTELNVTIHAATASTATVEVMDMIGKTHHISTEQLAEGANKVTIETNDMPNGIYFIRVTANGETFTQKVIKK